MRKRAAKCSHHTYGILLSPHQKHQHTHRRSTRSAKRRLRFSIGGSLEQASGNEGVRVVPGELQRRDRGCGRDDAGLFADGKGWKCISVSRVLVTSSLLQSTLMCLVWVERGRDDCSLARRNWFCLSYCAVIATVPPSTRCHTIPESPQF